MQTWELKKYGQTESQGNHPGDRSTYLLSIKFLDSSRFPSMLWKSVDHSCGEVKLGWCFSLYRQIFLLVRMLAGFFLYLWSLVTLLWFDAQCIHFSWHVIYLFVCLFYFWKYSWTMSIFFYLLGSFQWGYYLWISLDWCLYYFHIILVQLFISNSFCLLFNLFLCVLLIFSSVFIPFCAYSNAGLISLCVLPGLSQLLGTV